MCPKKDKGRDVCMCAQNGRSMESSVDAVFGSPPSDLIIDYSKDEIDRGAYGVVYAGKRADRAVAVKRIHKALLEEHLAQGQQVLRGFQAECQRMKDIGEHTNVVEFIGAFVDKDGPFLVMEKMSQNLHTFLKTNRGTLKLQQQLRLCRDIAAGLAFLHSWKPPLVHRDLTARNVLLDESGRAKIGDLGQSKLRTAAHFQTRQPGAVPYMPPEALRTHPQYTEKVDIFSFGVLMLEIATQTPPSCGLDGINTIPEEERRSSDLARLAEDHSLLSLIRLCLKNEPGERPGAAILFEVLQESTKVSVAFSEAKKLFNGAIESLEESHHEVMQLAEDTASPEFGDVKGLSTARVAEILKVVERSEMKVVFFGRTSNGKSTVINALLKSKVLPSGYGSTTKGICYIRGQSTASKGGFVEFDGSNEIPVESAQALGSHMKGPRDIRINWSAAQCSMLMEDIVLIDCPGMNAAKEMDNKVIACCSDADVFVYVANGITTFETTERDMLAKVKERLSSPSNTFILFNHWDRVVEDGEEQASDVREQHLSTVTRIMVDDLSIFTKEMVADRTFFVSAKQALNNADQHAGHCQQQEFSRFERMLQECLLETAIKTKFGRHCSECQSVVARLKDAVTDMKPRCKEECEKREKELKTTKTVLAKIMEIQDFEQRCPEEVEKAVEEANAMCDKFHSNVEERLSEEVKKYQPEEVFDPAKCDQYCKTLKEHLQKKLREEEDCLNKHLADLAARTVQPLCELLHQLEEYARKLEEEKARSFQANGSQNGALLQVILNLKTHSGKQKLKDFGGGGALGSLTCVAGGGAVLNRVAPIAAAMGGLLATAATTIVVKSTPVALMVGSGIAYGIMKFGGMTERKAKEELCKQLTEVLKKWMDEIRIICKSYLEEYVKSYTDEALKLGEQKENLNAAVAKLEDKIQSLRKRQPDALIKRLEEVDSQFQQFRETYLEV